MHKNTAFVVTFLAVIAALLVGINLGRRFNGNPPAVSPGSMSTPTSSPQLKSFSHSGCGVVFDYPAAFTVTEASDSAQLTQSGSEEKIVLICGLDFPKPPLPPEKIETATVAAQPATIYHDSQAKDGQPVNVVVFTNPKNKLEVALFGFGEIFQALISSLRLF